MIKPEEVRVGNYYQYDGKYFKFDIATAQIILNLIERDDCPSEPIPLTPEILKAAGFERVSKTFYHMPCYEPVPSKKISMAYEIDRRIVTVMMLEVGGISYLHQLQNLIFALTGEELAINLSALAIDADKQ